MVDGEMCNLPLADSRALCNLPFVVLSIHSPTMPALYPTLNLLVSSEIDSTVSASSVSICSSPVAAARLKPQLTPKSARPLSSLNTIEPGCTCIVHRSSCSR